MDRDVSASTRKHTQAPGHTRIHTYNGMSKAIQTLNGLRNVVIKKLENDSVQSQ